MLQSISPYALLCASKPKPIPAVVTSYDLFSQAQQPAVSKDAPRKLDTQDDPPAAHLQTAPVSAALPKPAQRTHYIADIHARHSAASRRTPLRNQPLT